MQILSDIGKMNLSRAEKAGVAIVYSAFAGFLAMSATMLPLTIMVAATEEAIKRRRQFS